jgi:hypothetical protein
MAVVPVPIHVYPQLDQLRTGVGAAQFAAILMGNGMIFVSGFGCLKAVKYGTMVNNGGTITVSGINLTPFGTANPSLVPTNGAINTLIAPFLTVPVYDSIVANITFHGINFVGA